MPSEPSPRLCHVNHAMPSLPAVLPSKRSQDRFFKNIFFLPFRIPLNPFFSLRSFFRFSYNLFTHLFIYPFPPLPRNVHFFFSFSIFPPPLFFSLLFLSFPLFLFPLLFLFSFPLFSSPLSSPNLHPLIRSPENPNQLSLKTQPTYYKIKFCVSVSRALGKNLRLEMKG